LQQRLFLLFFFWYCWFFGFAQLSDNLKLIGFHVWQDMQVLSVCLTRETAALKKLARKKRERRENCKKGLQIGQLLALTTSSSSPAYPVCGFSRKMKSFESVCPTP